MVGTKFKAKEGKQVYTNTLIYLVGQVVLNKGMKYVHDNNKYTHYILPFVKSIIAVIV
jgi:hypothetical protein